MSKFSKGIFETSFTSAYVFSSLLDSMKTGEEVDSDLNSRVEELLSGSDSTSAGMFGRTPLHKAAYRYRLTMVLTR